MGEGGIKNGQKFPASFMDGPIRREEGVVQPSRRYEKKGDVFFALMYKIKSVSNTEFSIKTHFVAKIF